MELERKDNSNILIKPIKIAVATVVVVITLFIIGAVKDVPVYEIRKEVSL